MNNSNNNENEKKMPSKIPRKTKHKIDKFRGNLADKSPMMIERAMMKEELGSILSEQLGHSKQAPTILMELSKRQWHRMKKNAIHLSKASIIKSNDKNVLHNQIYYDSIEYGSNIKLQKNNFDVRTFKMKGCNSFLQASVMNYPTIKDRMIFITTDFDSVNKVNNMNNIIITSNNTPTFLDDKFHSSGKILIFIIRNTDSKDPDDNDEWLWRDSLLDKLKECKNSICIPGGKYNHFNSQGYIAAFGNKALFGSSPVKSTISQYVNKKGKTDKDKEIISNKAAVFEEIVANEVESAIAKFSKYFPNIRTLIAPILNIAHKKQEEAGDVHFKNVMTSEHGLWQSELCCDAITRDFHTERDITYTLISTPFQVKDNKEKTASKPTYFVLKINETSNIAFKMIPKSSFMFSGSMITHRQFSEDGYEDVKVRKGISHFYNIACYGNERMFHHLRQSFRRNLGLEKKK